MIEKIVLLYHEFKDAIMGSLVYFLYGRFFLKIDWRKGVISFFIGTVFAVYTSPVISNWLGWNISAVSFMVGLLGMKITEALIDVPIKDLFKSVLQTKIK